ncbi:hypothetical protein K438DRAFT_1766846 [Mycena galopus ATCC 62051]|nr:hypothetical protein K438DRAFT_1766846 [Mycena galopus ATCC 62051]
MGNIDLNILGATDIAGDEQNLYSVINVFYAGVRLDLGHWTADNLFTNTTSFRQLVLITSSANPAFRAVATTQGMAYASSTDPPQPDVPTPPAVIQIPYTCNIMQRKPIGSFAINVLSATLSMFLGTWGLMIAILSFIVGKNPGGASPAGFTQCCKFMRVAQSKPAAIEQRKVVRFMVSLRHDPQSVKILEESGRLGANEDLGPTRPSVSGVKVRPCYEDMEYRPANGNRPQSEKLRRLRPVNKKAVALIFSKLHSGSNGKIQCVKIGMSVEFRKAKDTGKTHSQARLSGRLSTAVKWETWTDTGGRWASRKRPVKTPLKTLRWNRVVAVYGSAEGSDPVEATVGDHITVTPRIYYVSRAHGG